MDVILRRPKLGRTSAREVARRMNHQVLVVRHDRDPLPQHIGYLFRWGCLAQAQAEHVVNSADAIQRANNKFQARCLMDREGVLIPRTWKPEDHPAIPEGGLIVRQDFHHQGRRLYHVRTDYELRRAVDRLLQLGKGVYLSEYIPKDREFRIFVVSGRVAGVAEKTRGNATGVAWNHYLGGSFTNVRWKDWPIRCCEEGLKAAVAIGLDFGGIDVMLKGDMPYVLEANSAPSMTSEYRQSFFARCFDWIIEHGKERIPLVKPKKSAIYSHLIHPAVAGEARLEAE